MWKTPAKLPPAGSISARSVGSASTSGMVRDINFGTEDGRCLERLTAVIFKVSACLLMHFPLLAAHVCQLAAWWHDSDQLVASMQITTCQMHPRRFFNS